MFNKFRVVISCSFKEVDENLGKYLLVIRSQLWEDSGTDI
jgi:hypothetical protein